MAGDPRHAGGQPAQAVQAEVAEHDPGVERGQGQGGGQHALLDLHGRRHRRRVFQDEGADDDRAGLEHGGMAGEGQQGGD